MLKIIVCDDDSFTLSMISDILTSLISTLSLEAEIACLASSTREVMAYLNRNPDTYLFFLDLDMGSCQLNGIDLAQRLREKAIPAKIVFVTSHIEKCMAILKSGVEPFDFIEKKFNTAVMTAEFKRCLTKCMNLEIGSVEVASHTVELPVGIDEYVSIPVDRVAYVETIKGQAHNICYHTTDGSQITVRDSISHALELLGDDFVLSHRSVAVNRRCVVGMADGQLKLSNGERVSCAANKKKLFMNR
ncbi:MAG: LytTR family DNA-binding domain-containing protein [Hungatella sp.]|jgi:DNA-binding LytR/AlgR family response regulator|nr:LytTR family DNA-binding domain-containing protein [Hungatella sp.]